MSSRPAKAALQAAGIDGPTINAALLAIGHTVENAQTHSWRWT
jgi:hypothetical protein